MNTPVDVLLAVVAIGGKLGIAGDKLRMLLPADCPAQLKDSIRRHKSALIELLQSNFLVVHSEALAEILLWAPDENTKEALVAAGANRGAIYTAAELETLTRRITVEDLCLIHAAKRRFDGKVRGA